MSLSTQDRYAVVILGGGPAGCAAAITLADRGVDDVLLVEAGDYGAPRVGESIPPDTRLLLDQLGLWADFQREGHDVCYGSCASWGSEELGFNDFLFNARGTGWHLDRRRFDAFLSRRAAGRGTRIRTGTCFRRLEHGREGGTLGLRVEGEDGVHTVHADFVVDATGHRGAFAKAMGARTDVLDRLICVYGFFELDPGSKLSRLTMLEAVRDGWWYAARLPGGKATAAFAADAETVKRDRLRIERAWLWHLTDTLHVAPALSRSRFVSSSLLTVPALSLLRRPVAGNRWLAVGDAATVYDPTSAQGVYKALLDGTAAGVAIAERIGGRIASFDEYAALVRARFESYMANRSHLYGLETRWPEAPFWTRRRERSSPIAA